MTDTPEHDIVIGGDQTIVGGEADDILVGDINDQTIIGGDGDDLIFGDTTTGDDITQNGDFAEHTSFSNGGWGLFDEIDGWQQWGDNPIEIQASGTVGTAMTGDSVLELDSTGNSGLQQSFGGLAAGSFVTLTIFFSARPRVPEASNVMEVWWNGELIDTVSANGIGLTDFVFTEHTYTFEIPASGEALVGIRGAGTEDSLGGIVDSINFAAVEPDEEGGKDYLSGGEGDDELHGGGDRDWLEGGEGADHLDGGDGSDSVVYADSRAAVLINLETGAGDGGEAVGDTYTDVENAHGSQFDDVFIGDDGANRFVGRAGDDEIYGGGGNDTLIGGQGADLLDGGDGDRDVAEYDWSRSAVDVNLTTGLGFGGFAEGDQLINIEDLRGSFYNDTLTGDEGVNRISGDLGDDALSGMGGRDVLLGGLGADTIDGGEGTDTASYQFAETAVGVDLSTGGFDGEATGDTFIDVEAVYGSEHDDAIRGDSGANRLNGQVGNDQLDGADGRDTLIGGLGDDNLTGGAGLDTFLFEAAFGNDTITDFVAGDNIVDRIWFKGLGLELADLTISDTTAGAYIEAGSYGTLLLEGLTASDLVADDFIF